MIYLLTLEIGGTTVRVATERHTVTSAAGDLVFGSGLAPQSYRRAFAPGDLPSVRIPVTLHAGVIDVPDLIRQGYRVELARAELAAVTPGQTWEQRDIIGGGIVSELVYSEGASVRFGIRMIPSRTDLAIPSIQARVSEDTWGTDVPREADGLVIPIVFGEPAFELPFAYKATAGSPAVCVRGDGPNNQPAAGAPIYICAEQVHASTVQICYAASEVGDRDWQDNVTVYNNENGARVGLPIPLHGSGSDKARFLIRWDDGCGVIRPTSPDPVRTLGELLEYLLWKLPECDRDRTSAAVAHLPMLVDGYIDARTGVLAWIRGNILPHWPVQIVSGPAGIYPVVGRPYLRPDAPVRELSTERREIFPTGEVVYDGSDDIYNEVEVQFKRDCGTRQYLGTIVHTGDPDNAPTALNTSDNVAMSPLAMASFGAYGGSRSKVMRTNIVHRAITAHQMASAWIRRYALPSRQSAYTMPSKPDWVEPGVGVQIVDHINEIRQLCVVEEVAPLEGTRHTMTVRTVAVD